MDFIYSKSQLQEYRLENLSFKYSDCNKTFEFLKYKPNELYDQKIKFNKISSKLGETLYEDPISGYKYKEESFKYKEYCYVIAFFDLKDGHEPDIRTVGSRLNELDDHELLVFKKLMQYAYNILGDARLKDFKMFMDSINN